MENARLAAISRPRARLERDLPGIDTSRSASRENICHGAPARFSCDCRGGRAAGGVHSRGPLWRTLRTSAIPDLSFIQPARRTGSSARTSFAQRVSDRDNPAVGGHRAVEDIIGLEKGFARWWAQRQARWSPDDCAFDVSSYQDPLTVRACSHRKDRRVVGLSRIRFARAIRRFLSPAYGTRGTVKPARPKSRRESLAAWDVPVPGVSKFSDRRMPCPDRKRGCGIGAGESWVIFK